MLTNPLSIKRRELLRIGAIGAGGLSLARALELIETIPLAARLYRKPAKSVIMIWLDGGASHIDTFDPKPGAPEEVRGAWGSVPTPLPGVHFGQGLEKLASLLPKFSLIRSLTSDAGEHEIARHLLLTGYPMTPALEYPGFGAVASQLTKNPPFPPYVAMSLIAGHARQLGPGFLPSEHAPLLIDSNPARPEYSVRDLLPPAGTTSARIDKRKELLNQFDQFRRDHESDSNVRARTAAFERAYKLIATKESREAFDLTKETVKTRERYGDHALGQSCLLARRLVEAGARFITIMDSGWDNHGRVHEQLFRHRLPKLDQAIPVLLEDLTTRGLLDETFIVVMGDFGRTPRLNAMDGRDHWPRANCALFAGAGIKGGKVVGSTDERAEQVAERPVSPGDLAATIYTLLGIDPHGELMTAEGRPISLVKDGKAIDEILL
ncbi:MAG: DUF1501 domain-containing protein [Planctomycetota bacterium]